eukprot:CAMPEP_0179219154 /NCGR_PEP_ID=MMETSP0797-20121207/4879_1 /TAXON_ID=47934 /ORGANISM="Dinophysis acuminata, Strain DAEP01" /LENGTH=332 /DNA_ID=CAMNT_0020925597 /DNA_START=93 /DNA_END=1091 /DNA_ORIENTATION=+
MPEVRHRPVRALQRISTPRAGGGVSRERQHIPQGGSPAGLSEGNNGHASPGGRAGGRAGGDEYQLADMSEADMLQQALAMSRLEAERTRRDAAPAPPHPQVPEGTGAASTAQRGALLSEDDPALMAAIAASYASGSNRASQYSDQQLVEQAIRRSKQEEENRDRARLRDEQAAEYEESLCIDRQREEERAMRRKEEEEVRRREAEEEERRQREAEELQREAEEADRLREQQIAKLADEAQSELRPEPPQGAPGRVQVLVRAPDGRRLKRAFLASDAISQIYFFTNLEASEVLAGREYCLVSAMPRRTYEDRDATLESAGLQGQCALLIEIID